MKHIIPPSTLDRDFLDFFQSYWKDRPLSEFEKLLKLLKAKEISLTHIFPESKELQRCQDLFWLREQMIDFVEQKIKQYASKTLYLGDFSSQSASKFSGVLSQLQESVKSYYDWGYDFVFRPKDNSEESSKYTTLKR